MFIADAQTGTFSKKIGKVVKPYPLSGAVFHFMPVAPKTLPTGRQVFDLVRVTFMVCIYCYLSLFN